MKKFTHQILFAFFILFTLTVFVHLANHYLKWQLHPYFLLELRFFCLSFVIYYGVQKNSLTTWILISMIIGAEVGHSFPEIGVNLQLISKIFLRLIKTVIAPLLFSTLVVGIAGHSDLKQVGRMGWKSIVYFEIVSTLALVIGLIAINLSKAGVGITLPPVAHQEALQSIKQQSFSDIILHIFPDNIAKAIYDAEILQIVVFSIIFGISVAMLKGSSKERMIHFAEGLSETMFKFTNLIMRFAPFAVGAAIAYSIGHMGIDILINLFWLLATLYGALISLVLLVFLPIALIIRLPILNFIRAIAEPTSIAFATTSSESALPRALEAMEKFGVPRKIVSFVLPTGYSFNLDGTTLYLALASIFVAQSAGIHLSIEKQIVMMLTLMLTSKGVAAVPRASLVILLGTAVSFGLPVEPIFIILGIDELMDMARTSINVVGNCLASTVIARWEGEFDDEKARNFHNIMAKTD